VRRSNLASFRGGGSDAGSRRPGSATFAIGLLTALLAAAAIRAQSAQPDEADPGVRPAGEAGEAEPSDVFNEEEKKSDTGLPETFVAPADVPPEIEIEDELLTQEELVELPRTLMKASFQRSVVLKGVLNNETRELIKDGVRYYVHLLSMRENRRSLDDVTEDILRLVGWAAAQQPNESQKREFRRFLLEQIVDRASELLDGNFHVRINAALLLSQLDIVERSRNTRPEAFAPAAEPLVGVLADEKQPVAVKLVAANGLRRIASYGSLSTNQKIAIADAAIRDLGKMESHWWYQSVLLETLGALDQIHDLERSPFILQALVQVMTDPRRSWIVRSEAAKALGRARVDAQVNIGLVAYEIVRLTRQIAAARAQKPGEFYWDWCFWNLYLAFNPVDSEERLRDAGLLVKVQNATLRQHQNKVREAYNMVLPLAQKVLNPKTESAIGEAETKLLDDWLRQNQPENLQVAPGLQPITTTGADGQPRQASTR